MLAGLRKYVSRIPALLGRILPWGKSPPPAPKAPAKPIKAVSLKNQSELENLCAALFKKKDMVTSGRLQFIGLKKIQDRLGNKWESLKSLVFDTADAVINEYAQEGDIFIPYKDDTYILIFAEASLEEGRVRANMIASEIQRRLFTFDEEKFRDLEVRKAISEMKTDFVEDMEFDDFLNSFGTEETPYEDEELPEKKGVSSQKDVSAGKERAAAADDEAVSGGKGKFALEDVPVTDVDSQDYDPTAASRQEKSELPDSIKFTYLPLWDVPRNALTTYMCMGHEDTTSQNDLLDAHKEFYNGLSATQRVNLDIKTLEHVMEELTAMERDQRKLLIICPVHYDTLYHSKDYTRYKAVLEQIPGVHKPFLMFLIMNMRQGRPPKNPYWFAAPLRGFCRHVFAEVPLRRDINFHYLSNTGVDVVGVRLDHETVSEQEAITILNGISAKAKKIKISKTFVFGISSLSLTTSAVCAGFDFLGGTAIHEGVARPDTVHRYQYQDLISGLLSKQE